MINAALTQARETAEELTVESEGPDALDDDDALWCEYLSDADDYLDAEQLLDAAADILTALKP